MDFEKLGLDVMNPSFILQNLVTLCDASEEINRSLKNRELIENSISSQILFLISSLNTHFYKPYQAKLRICVLGCGGNMGSQIVEKLVKEGGFSSNLILISRDEKKFPLHLFQEEEEEDNSSKNGPISPSSHTTTETEELQKEQGNQQNDEIGEGEEVVSLISCEEILNQSTIHSSSSSSQTTTKTTRASKKSQQLFTSIIDPSLPPYSILILCLGSSHLRF